MSSFSDLVKNRCRKKIQVIHDALDIPLVGLLCIKLIVSNYLLSVAKCNEKIANLAQWNIYPFSGDYVEDPEDYYPGWTRYYFFIDGLQPIVTLSGRFVEAKPHRSAQVQYTELTFQIPDVNVRTKLKELNAEISRTLGSHSRDSLAWSQGDAGVENINLIVYRNDQKIDYSTTQLFNLVIDFTTVSCFKRPRLLNYF